MSVTLNDWIARVERRETHVAIIGLGYVGLPLALLFAEEGIRVIGFDIDPEKVATLNAGRSYIHRIEPAHIAAAQAAGFKATTDISQLHACDAVLICVPTPLHPDHTPDMSFVNSTLEALAPHTRPGQLIVLESTTYPGTTSEIVVPILERLGPSGSSVGRDEGSGSRAQGSGSRDEGPGSRAQGSGSRAQGSGSRAQGSEREGLAGPLALDPIPSLLVAFSPEREDPGNTMPRRAIPKVIGGISADASKAAAALYGTIFDRTVVVSSTEAAEMTKLLENIYRVVNIALVNELKQLCLAMGIDIWEVIDAASTKPFGFQAFYPGPGIGGHCIPVDPFYLSWRARQFNQPTRFIELAGEINEAMPGFVLRTIERALEREQKSLAGAKILILGMAYKRDVDDLRESPALTLFDLLERADAQVAYNDPFFPTVGRGRRYKLETASTPLDEVPAFDCVVLVTDHSAYDIPALVAASRLFVDTRNATQGLTSPNIIRC